MSIFSCPDQSKVAEILLENNLPIDDLSELNLENFFGCGDETKLKGVVGLEIFGTDGLLRSLAVSKEARGLGCGKALVAKIEEHARFNGIRNLYLLTQTAEVFFSNLGYEEINREIVSEPIKHTREFSDLCPDSATVMRKSLET